MALPILGALCNVSAWIDPPITVAKLEQLPKLSPDLVARESKFSSAVYVVQSNLEKRIINKSALRRFALDHNLPIFSRIKKARVGDNKFCAEKGAVFRGHGVDKSKFFFVQGMHIVQETSRGHESW